MVGVSDRAAVASGVWVGNSVGAGDGTGATAGNIDEQPNIARHKNPIVIFAEVFIFSTLRFP
jgi:hypothetical protein